MFEEKSVNYSYVVSSTSDARRYGSFRADFKFRLSIIGCETAERTDFADRTRRNGQQAVGRSISASKRFRGENNFFKCGRENVI